MKLQVKLSDLVSSKSETEILEFKEAKNTCDFDKLGEYFGVNQ